MKDLEPITREETMLAKVAGQDVPELEPVTREEYFLAKAAGQDVPELEPVTRKEYFLADVIEAIESGGGGSDLGTKTVSENGVYNATDDSLDGYSKVTVDVPASAVDSGTKEISSNGSHDVTGYASASVSVPNSYEAGDEGKVVSNGALVAQTSDTVTENDTYDTTTISSLTVNVSGGGGGLTLIDTITASAVNATKIDIDASWFDTYTFVFIVPNLTFSQSEWLYCAMNATSNGQYYNASVSSMGENGTMTLRKLVTRSNKIGAAWYNTNNPGIVSFVNISYLYFYLYNASSTMTGEFKIYGVTI